MPVCYEKEEEKGVSSLRRRARQVLSVARRCRSPRRAAGGAGRSSSLVDVLDQSSVSRYHLVRAERAHTDCALQSWSWYACTHVAGKEGPNDSRVSHHSAEIRSDVCNSRPSQQHSVLIVQVCALCVSLQQLLSFGCISDTFHAIMMIESLQHQVTVLLYFYTLPAIVHRLL